VSARAKSLYHKNIFWNENDSNWHIDSSLELAVSSFGPELNHKYNYELWQKLGDTYIHISLINHGGNYDNNNYAFIRIYNNKTVDIASQLCIKYGLIFNFIYDFINEMKPKNNEICYYDMTAFDTLSLIKFIKKYRTSLILFCEIRLSLFNYFLQGRGHCRQHVGR
jgi:hypothetical protein